MSPALNGLIAIIMILKCVSIRTSLDIPIHLVYHVIVTWSISHYLNYTCGIQMHL